MHLLTLAALALAPASQTTAQSADFSLGMRLGSAPPEPIVLDDRYLEPPLGAGVADDMLLDELNATISTGEDLGLPPEFLNWRTYQMDDMSLNWGLANIGPGALAPQPGIGGGGGGGAPGGGGNRGNSSSPLFRDTTRPPIPPPTPIGPQPVPEPQTLGIWALTALGVAGWSRRRKTAA